MELGSNVWVMSFLNTLCRSLKIWLLWNVIVMISMKPVLVKTSNNSEGTRCEKYMQYVIIWSEIAYCMVTLTHWGRVMHICISKLARSSLVQIMAWHLLGAQAIIWTNAGIFLIGSLGTNFLENLIKIHTFSFKKMHLKMLFVKWRQFRLGLNVLTSIVIILQ